MSPVRSAAWPIPMVLFIAAAMAGLPAEGGPTGALADPRLSRRVTVLAARVPVAEVVATIGSRCGVPLQTAGVVDRTLVCVAAREVPAAAVLRQIGAAVGAEWQTGAGGRGPVLALTRSTLEQEEQFRRSETVALLRGVAATGSRRGTREGREGEQALAVIHQALPPQLAEALVARRHVQLRFAALPRDTAARLAEQLAPAVEASRRAAEESRLLNPQLYRNAPPLPVVVNPEQLELGLAIQPLPRRRLITALRLPWNSVLQVVQEDAAPAPASAREQPADGEAAGAFGAGLARRFQELTARGHPRCTWTRLLLALSETAGLPVTADWYPPPPEPHRLDTPEPPYVLPQHLRRAPTVEVALDALCSAPGPFGMRRWKREHGALVLEVRDRHWHREQLLPRAVTLRLRQLRAQKQGFGPADLPLLAQLRRPQIDGVRAYPHPFGQEAWDAVVPVVATWPLPQRRPVFSGATPLGAGTCAITSLLQPAAAYLIVFWSDPVAGQRALELFFRYPDATRELLLVS